MALRAVQSVAMATGVMIQRTNTDLSAHIVLALDLIEVVMTTKEILSKSLILNPLTTMSREINESPLLRYLFFFEGEENGFTFEVDAKNQEEAFDIAIRGIS
jgi:hypothetical protein